MLEVMRRLQKTPHPNQVFYAATVQEKAASKCAAHKLLRV
jgi:putative aminopeptidase FrvX